jgi:hypothetical protein
MLPLQLDLDLATMISRSQPAFAAACCADPAALQTLVALPQLEVKGEQAHMSALLRLAPAIAEPANAGLAGAFYASARRYDEQNPRQADQAVRPLALAFGPIGRVFAEAPSHDNFALLAYRQANTYLNDKVVELRNAGGEPFDLLSLRCAERLSLQAYINADSRGSDLAVAALAQWQNVSMRILRVLTADGVRMAQACLPFGSVMAKICVERILGNALKLADTNLEGARAAVAAATPYASDEKTAERAADITQRLTARRSNPRRLAYR